MRLRVELPEVGVTAEATLYDRAAPRVCAAIYAALADAARDAHLARVLRRPRGLLLPAAVPRAAAGREPDDAP